MIETHLPFAPSAALTAPPRAAWLERLRAAVLIVGLWTLFAVLRANVLYFLLPLTGGTAYRWSTMFRWSLPEALVWSVMTPGILALARRRPVFGPGWRLNLGIHTLAALGIHVVAALSYIPLRPAREPMPLTARLLDGTLFDFVLYAIVAAVANAMSFQEAAQRQLREALRLRSQLAESRLQALTLQLQPHFLFNALHAISELVYQDPKLADRAINRLSELLRMALASSGQIEGTLEEELRFLDAYAEIERLRLGERFRLNVDVPAETLRMTVPVLLLQPLVENAFRHGLRRGGTSVEVSARHHDGELILTVRDDGPGPGASPSEGIGLRNTRARLESLYGAGQRLELRARPGGGAEVELSLPVRTLGPVPAVELPGRIA